MSFGAIAASYFALAESPANYTVFGAAPPSYSMTVYDDGTPNIELGNIFYLASATGSKIGWRCMGGRVYVPNDARVTNRPICLRAYIGAGGDFYGAAGVDFVQQKTTTTPAGGGWCEVLWDVPITLEYGPDDCFVLITYAFTDPADQMKYMVGSGVSSATVDSIELGAALCLGAASGGSVWQQRGRYAMGSGVSFSRIGSWYGTDIIVAEPAAPNSFLPIAAYDFNEGSGTVIGDVTGNGHALTTQTQYFTASGHSGSGLQQLSANNGSIVSTNGSFTALDTRVQREFTIMFWGKYASNGTAGDNWTLRQTAYGGPALTAWGVQMSNGTNAIFFLQIQGYGVPLTAPKQPANEWHHYALTGNGYTSRWYVDGVLIGEYVDGGVVGLGNDANLVAFDVSSMQGQVIDDIRFYTAALSPAAIVYHMDH